MDRYGCNALPSPRIPNSHNPRSALEIWALVGSISVYEAIQPRLSRPRSFFSGRRMSDHDNIDYLLTSWEYEPYNVNARIVQGDDGRDVLQMRIDMGILQMEMKGRPDGTHPHQHESMLDYLSIKAENAGEDYQFSEDECFEIDREFVQFYHRRVCWLQLRRFDMAIKDANHTLSLMDLCQDFHPDDQWAIAHEQYRPFVLFHRIQAEALYMLDEGDGGESAVEAINQGLDELRALFDAYGIEDRFEEDDLVQRLIEVREDIRNRYEVGETLQEQLTKAVAQEQYELAARLRDELARREVGPH